MLGAIELGEIASEKVGQAIGAVTDGVRGTVASLKRAWASGCSKRDIASIPRSALAIHVIPCMTT